MFKQKNVNEFESKENCTLIDFEECTFCDGERNDNDACDICDGQWYDLID